MKVEFYKLGSQMHPLKFVVIQGNYQGKWIFVRHKDRTTWEIPGGHIEDNEDVEDAARRELCEETGALDFQLVPLCEYSVEKEHSKSFGRLYFAKVFELGSLDYEIEEITLSHELPTQLTYQEIQPYIFEKGLDFIRSSNNYSL